MDTILTILEIIGLVLAAVLIFVFGVLFARHNAKKAEAIQKGVNISVSSSGEAAKAYADRIKAKIPRSIL